MLTWRECRKLSYLMNIWDDTNLPYTENYVNISQQVIDFFNTESQLIYPAKSYFVAIVYAKGLEKHFGINFYEALNFNDLLPDDNFFSPYTKNKLLYDEILDSINFSFDMPSIQKTYDYFKKEFLIK